MTASTTDRARVSPNSGHSDVAPRRLTTETKSSFKTTEMAFYILAVIGVLLASYDATPHFRTAARSVPATS